MIKAIVVDDERAPRGLLVSLLNDFVDEVSVIGEAKNVAEAKKLIEENDFDVLFLDVEMPELDGFDLLRLLKEVSFEIIFVSAHSKYAIQAIKEDALAYILKPVRVVELVEAVEKLKQRISERDPLKAKPLIIPSHEVDNEQENNKIALPLAKGYKLVSISDILYLEADTRYTVFHIKDAPSIVVARHLKYFEGAFEKAGMVRVHNRYMISIFHVDSYIRTNGPGGEVVLKNNEKVPVSRAKKKNLLEKIEEFKVNA